MEGKDIDDSIKWICHAKTWEDAVHLTPEEFESVATGVRYDSNSDELLLDSLHYCAILENNKKEFCRKDMRQAIAARNYYLEILQRSEAK